MVGLSQAAFDFRCSIGAGCQVSDGKDEAGRTAIDVRRRSPK
jgi:hypothetical protein